MSNVGVSRRLRGRVFQETTAREEKAREPTVDSSVSGIREVRVSEAEWSVLMAVGHVGCSRVVDALLARVAILY